MKLNPIPFEQIQFGTKTIELRLNDPKRREIQVGDHILFSKLPDLKDRLVTEVCGLMIAPNFHEIFLSINPVDAGFAKGVALSEMVHNMQGYYSPEEQKQWGVIAIYLDLPKNKHIDH